jgi:hypothetical protein
MMAETIYQPTRAFTPDKQNRIFISSNAANLRGADNSANGRDRHASRNNERLPSIASPVPNRHIVEYNQ